MRVLSRDDAGYPPGLLDLPDPPERLYVQGALPARERAVAIVGSRAASPYGRARAHALAADLARLGFTIVSGLARGIDAAAHRGALDAGGASVAVLPSGLDRVTPAHHAALAAELAARGALATEWESGAPRGRGAFVTRNRIVAALSAATVVVEAAEASGALTTAAFARGLGRALLAVPGDVDRPTARGANALLRAGAAWCECAADVLRAIAHATPVPRPRRVRRAPGAEPALALDPADAADPARRLLRVLGARPRTVDELAEAAGLEAAETLPALFQLALGGVVRAWPGQRWALAPRAARGR